VSGEPAPRRGWRVLRVTWRVLRMWRVMLPLVVVQAATLAIFIPTAPQWAAVALIVVTFVFFAVIAPDMSRLVEEVGVPPRSTRSGRVPRHRSDRRPGEVPNGPEE
jgi:membrane protein YdbS with pleckstrin-like domain